MHVKTCRAEMVKAAGDGLADGQFEAIVAVFGNVDLGGDRIVLGAFADSLKSWEASGDPLPVLWSHRSEDPDFNIGQALEAKELAPGDPLLPESLKALGGLYIKAQLDLDAPKAQQVQRLLKGRRVTQFSFAYDIVEAESIIADGDHIFELRKLNVLEVGPTMYGMNPATDLIDAKALAELASEVKSGRVLSAKNEEALKAARDAIDGVLKALEDSQDDGKRTATPPSVTGTEEPSGAKATGATGGTASSKPADTLALEVAMELAQG